MGAVNCKPFSHRRSDAVMPKVIHVRSKSERAAEKKQKKSAREFFRAIRLLRKRSNKIVPVTPIGDSSACPVSCSESY